jgi:hypothetical protein
MIGDQLGLLGLLERDERAPAIRRSPTSRAAASSIAPALGALQGQLLRHVCSMGSAGCTDEEAQIALSMNPSTQRPRRIELARDGLIVDSGETRKTRSGRSARVYRATEKGAHRGTW